MAVDPALEDSPTSLLTDNTDRLRQSDLRRCSEKTDQNHSQIAGQGAVGHILFSGVWNAV